jgi:hypothetical protein
MNGMKLLVDFSCVEQNEIGEKEITPKNKYLNDFDETTCIYYKSSRLTKTDPISFEEMTETNSFKFPYMWDPYTGGRLDLDPFGPLYFHPINILQTIYHSRLRDLWIEIKETDGKYESYGEGVGIGENFEIIGRGMYPEHNIFRLPIPNCYLKKNHNMSLVTMGPLLNDLEIKEIDELLLKHWSNHKIFKKIYAKIGSLYKLKCYYDIAIAKSPTSIVTKRKMKELNFSNNIMRKTNPNMYLNRLAVDAIRKMK